MTGRLLLASALLVAHTPPAHAQRYVSAVAPHAGSVEVAGAVTWTAPIPSDATSATETRNATAASGTLTLFDADVRTKSAAGIAGRIGVFLSDRVSVEGGLGFSRPILSIRLSSDFESAPDTTAEETLTRYVFDGSLLYHLRTGRAMPFVFGGAGYVRELHDDGAELVSGSEYHAGGGLKYWFGTGAHRAGLRVDGRISARDKRLDVTGRRRYLPVLTAGFTFLF